MNLILWIGLVALPEPGQEPAQGSLYDRAARASVEVLVGGQLKGSGWFATPEGHVVTAAHVAWKAGGALEVRAQGQERLSARAVAFDRGHDLALLKVPAEFAKAWRFAMATAK